MTGQTRKGPWVPHAGICDCSKFSGQAKDPGVRAGRIGKRTRACGAGGAMRMKMKK